MSHCDHTGCPCVPLAPRPPTDKEIIEGALQKVAAARKAELDETARLRARLLCVRCGADSSTLDAEHHCSTCYAESQATISRLRKRVQVLEDALRPFAHEEFRDSSGLPDAFRVECAMPLGVLRAARAALGST